LEALSLELGLSELVQFHGAATQERVLKWWQGATLGVLSSDNEGMPVSLMEAAACGVPVVATAVGGVPELVADGVTGLLAPKGDAVALAAALELGPADDLVILAAGTDGTDGPTDAAGAIVDGGTRERGGPDARRWLEDNDAYAYLARSGDLLVTGPTNTNLLDVYLVLHPRGPVPH